MMATRTDNGERVLLLLDRENGRLLEIAVDIAAWRGLELLALVVEDSDLLASAGLPFAREIGMTSGIARPLLAGDLERRMRERAERLRARLDQLARERGVRAVLEVGRGRQPAATLGRARPGDLLILHRDDRVQRLTGTVERIVSEATCAVMLIDPGVHPLAEGPMVVLDASEGSTRALSRAIALTRGEREILTLLIAPGEGDTSARQRAHRLLAEQGIESRVSELERGNLGEVVRFARRTNPRLLFISRESPVLRAPMAHWLEQLEELPLVLVP